MAESCCLRKNSFCCFDSDSSTEVAILLDTSEMEMTLMNISLAIESRVLGSGEDRMAEYTN